MSKILMCYPHSSSDGWEETGRFIHEAFNRAGHTVVPFDDLYWAGKLDSVVAMNDLLIKKIAKEKPDFFFMLKCEKVLPHYLDNIKCPKIYWHPDVRVNVQDWVVDKAKKCDIFYTMSKGSIPQYKAAGVDRVEYLPEACDPHYHFFASEVDDYWKSDVNFIGSVRQSRIDMCKRVIDDGFDFKVWGDLKFDNNDKRYLLADMECIKSKFMGKAVYREFHSYAASGGISVTWDWCPEVELSYSARIYRVMASRGLYLCKYVNGMEKVFQRGVHCDWYDDLDEMSQKIQYYLDNPKIKEQIGLAAQKEVYEKHTFDNRINVMTKWMKKN